jgi:hypothetical protein
MGEESLGIANVTVAQALQAVEKEQSEVDKWNAKIDNEENVNGPRMTIYVERVEEAYERLKDANERLEKAREYHLQVTQNDRALSVPSETGHPFFSRVQSANEEHDMLTFPARIPLTKRYQMYIRSAYKDIYETAMTREDAEVPKYAVVTGTPGIGKSLFLYYVFWRMVMAKKRVFFITKYIYFDGSKMLEFDSLPPRIDRQFWTIDLWCLIDSADPITVPGLPVNDCSILLVSTPRGDYLRRFMKLVPIPPVFYMPLWSRTELESIIDSYPNANAWEKRFIALGGIPRYVFEDVSKHPESLLRSACGQCSLDDAIHVVSIDSITEKANKVQTLIHLHSEYPYTKAEVRYASPAAIRIIVHLHWQRCHEEIQALLGSANGNPLAAALCRYIFEPFAKKLLQKGGQFDCRELVVGRAHKKGTFKITVPSSPEPAIVAESVAANQKRHQLYVPKTSNNASIDAWMPGFGAFQMTVGKTRDIKNGATAEIANLGNGSYRLFWLLPPLYYDSFTKKKPQRFDFEQYAILIPYPEVVDQS